MGYNPVVGGTHKPLAGTVKPAENLDVDPTSLDRAYTAQMEHDGMTWTYVLFAQWNSENDVVALAEAHIIGRPFVSDVALKRVEDDVVLYLLATMLAEETTKPVRSTDAR